MGERGRGVSRWLSGVDKRPPWLVRVAFFVAGLVVLGVTYLAAEPEGRLLAYLLQWLVLLVIMGAVWPWLNWRFGRRDEFTEVARERKVPFGVFALSLAFAVPWGALMWVAWFWVLGKWFWVWVVLWPLLEVFSYFGARRLRRDGAQAWKVRD